MPGQATSNMEHWLSELIATPAGLYFPIQMDIPSQSMLIMKLADKSFKCRLMTKTM